MCAAVIKAPYCDTTSPFAKKIGETYQFKTDFPITSGNSAIFCTEGTPFHEGGFYFTKFLAAGKGSAGFYCGSTRVCVGTVA